MEHISKAISTDRISQGYESAQDSTRSLKVWVQLAEMFGKPFFREHGVEPPNLWCQAISRLTDAQIANGLANLGNDELTFPPNLSQFIGSCKRQKPVRHLGVKCLPMTNYERERNAAKAWEDMERLAGRSLRND